MSSTFDPMDLDRLLGPDDVETEDLVLSLTFECLNDTPKSMKNALYTTQVKKYTDLQQAASDVELMFPSDLGEMMKASTPPTLPWFKSLPNFSCPGFIVYLLVLTKPGHRYKIYIGSGTDSRFGGSSRLDHYDYSDALPQLVKKALDDGYVIAHKGLLAWTTTLPRPGLVPKTRLLFLALEATFAYNFWAMRAYKKDYGMGHMSLWPRLELEYDGLCSHCCLYEGIRRNFDLSDEQLEEVAALRAENTRQRSAIFTHNWNVAFRERDPEGYRAWYRSNGSDYHFRQMAFNYDEYTTRKLNERRARRAANPEKYEEQLATRREELNADSEVARENNSHFCDDCNHGFATDKALTVHLKSPKHQQVVNADRTSPLWCAACHTISSSAYTWSTHIKSQRHLDNVVAFEIVKAIEVFDAAVLQAFEAAEVEAELDAELDVHDMGLMEFDMYLD
ncbi:hypothetical protein KCU65_g4357, partial [Aureobasidium melanogenum]